MRNTEKIFLSFLFISLLLFSCKKEKPFESNAELTGYDMRMCQCCGGLQITIDNAPSAYGFFLVGEFPKDFVLGNNPQFPILVRVDYKIDTIRCGGTRVNISRIERR